LKPFEIRQSRIRELTNKALQGATVDELFQRMDQWKISPSTAKSYYAEVVERLNK
jgi:hypothetical protein